MNTFIKAKTEQDGEICIAVQDYPMCGGVYVAITKKGRHLDQFGVKMTETLSSNAIMIITAITPKMLGLGFILKKLISSTISRESNVV